VVVAPKAEARHAAIFADATLDEQVDLMVARPIVLVEVGELAANLSTELRLPPNK
jgi:hypothetical protein